jgi:hypothetical protein
MAEEIVHKMRFGATELAAAVAAREGGSASIPAALLPELVAQTYVEDAVTASAAAEKPLATLSPRPQLITYDVRRSGKKLQLHIGSMGLRLEDKGKPVDSYPYQLCRGWHSGDGSLELDLLDGNHVSLKTRSADEIAASMELITEELRKATKPKLKLEANDTDEEQDDGDGDEALA